jgi:hypothetical protein
MSWLRAAVRAGAAGSAALPRRVPKVAERHAAAAHLRALFERLDPCDPGRPE